jgi:hypothetical protein
MTPTGNYGFFACSVTDLASLMLDNILYFGRFKEGQPPEAQVWILSKYDAVTWEKLGEVEIPLDHPYERVGGLTIAQVGEQLVLSGDYWEGGEEGGPTGSHHHSFSLDLEPQGEMLLLDPPLPMLSMIEMENDILVFGSTAMDGDLLVGRYDKSWKHIESSALKPRAFFPQGSVWDGKRFYIAHLDSSQRTNGGFPWYINIHLAVYDRDWNLLEDVAVTSYGPSDQMDVSGPWVLLHENRLYVSYVVAPIAEMAAKIIPFQTYVSVYELTQGDP